MLLRFALLSLLLASVLAVAWWGFQGPLLVADVKRPLSRWHHESPPFGFPPVWEKELADVLAKAPTISLLGEGVQAKVAELLNQVRWIQPHSKKILRRSSRILRPAWYHAHYGRSAKRIL